MAWRRLLYSAKIKQLRLLGSRAKWPRQLLVNLMRNDQGRSKPEITLPLASTVLHFMGMQTISSALLTAL
jgi:hypothetical protein